MIMLPEKHRVLVVDDEPDVFRVTQLSLKGMRYRGREVELVPAASGVEAIEAVRQRPDTAVILLDVVMESLTAGLEACRTIREDLGNRFVRILLRTGQPGIAPEKKAIDEYDIDGYLAKAELTATRLYAAVRTAIKAFEELVELERHRAVLKFIHDSAAALRSYEPLESTLQRVLTAALAIAGASLAVLDLRTFEEKGNPRRCFLHLSTRPDQAGAAASAAAVVSRVAADPSAAALRDAGPFGEGYLLPLVIPRELGSGWIYLEGGRLDPTVLQGLLLLAAHAANAIYSAVAQAMLAAREGPFYDSLSV